MSMSIIPKLRHIPDTAKLTVLVFLGFTLHNKRYIARIQRNLPIFEYLANRQLVQCHVDENEYGDYITDPNHSVVSFDLDTHRYNRHRVEVKVLEIHYHTNSGIDGVDNGTYTVVKKYYELGFDYMRHVIIGKRSW